MSDEILGRLLEVRFRDVEWRGNLCRRHGAFVLNGVEVGELNGTSRECFSSYTSMFPSISFVYKGNYSFYNLSF
jgi:hypothetical protein